MAPPPTVTGKVMLAQNISKLDVHKEHKKCIKQTTLAKHSLAYFGSYTVPYVST